MKENYLRLLLFPFSLVNFVGKLWKWKCDYSILLNEILCLTCLCLSLLLLSLSTLLLLLLLEKKNCRAASLPRDYGGDYIQMKLSHGPFFAPLFLYLIEWLDFSCTDALPTYLGLLQVLIFNVSHYHSSLSRLFLLSFCFFYLLFTLMYVCFVQVYVDGMPSISSRERKATIKEFYCMF